MPPPRILSPSQIDILLSFMDEHRDFASSVLQKHAKIETKKEVTSLWEKLASLLNAVKDGTKKSGDAWRRYWNEKKYSVRRKATVIQRSLNCGKSPRFNLTVEELKILDIMGRLAGKRDKLEVNEGTMEMPVLDEDSLGSDPLDQSSNEEKFQPDVKPEKQLEPKPLISNCNGTTMEENSGNHQHTDGPPQWAIDIEERRVLATERLAASLEQLTSAVVGMHESLRTLTHEVSTIRGVLVSRPP